ncbi:Formyltransferase [Clavulina sp. PMI_390]|nr:Formyltransferase [Clavulina sp. PMI_390]
MQWRSLTNSTRFHIRAFSTTSRASSRLNVVFLGREAFSCDTLTILHNAPDVWKSLYIVTTPDQWVGRRKKDLSISPLKSLAQSLNIPVIELPAQDDDPTHWIPSTFEPNSPENAIITASFGRAVPTSVLEQFQPSLRLNVHPSLLPKYRGAAPIQRMIMEGATTAGVSILQMEDVMTNGFDSGPLWDQREVAIPPRLTYHELENILAREGGHLLVDFLRRRANGEVIPRQQDHSQATKARTINDDTATVKWQLWDAYKIERYHRAFGHKHALHGTIDHGPRVRFLQLDLTPASATTSRLKAPGDATYDPHLRAVVVRCANDSFLAVTKVQTEGKKETVVRDYWNGVRPSEGKARVAQYDIVSTANNKL